MADFTWIGNVRGMIILANLNFIQDPYRIPHLKSVKNFFVFIILVYVLISGLIGIIKKNQIRLPTCEDKVAVINDRNDRWHQREWESTNNSFCTTYESFEALSLEAGEQRNEMIVDAYEYDDFWGEVYKNLVLDSKSYIHFLVDSLETVGQDRKLNKSELAELVVTFVQDIPYSYVLSRDCASRDTGDSPCIGNVAMGILSPYEFLHSLYGDCDTRSVLIYTILEELGFDPMIVVSNEYAHAMLALNVASSGDHLMHDGKKYYFWETTAKGWPIGMLPPNTNNVNYWEIALVNTNTM